MKNMKLSATILSVAFGLSVAMLIVSAAARDGGPSAQPAGASIGAEIDRTAYLGSGWGLELKL